MECFSELLDMQQTAPIVNAENLSFLLSPEDAPVLEETLQTRTGTEPLSGDVTVQAASPVVQPRRVSYLKFINKLHKIAHLKLQGLI